MAFALWITLFFFLYDSLVLAVSMQNHFLCISGLSLFIFFFALQHCKILVTLFLL